jgi:hypothetical protein
VSDTLILLEVLSGCSKVVVVECHAKGDVCFEWEEERRWRRRRRRRKR